MNNIVFRRFSDISFVTKHFYAWKVETFSIISYAYMRKVNRVCFQMENASLSKNKKYETQ